ncbi:hypothetical protein FGG08_003865 [Glutinoglossum americanum]|uniref:L-lactate dehydrogenase (cytochrome) n=1 Tax=Glutinoglossum americanum TaxID=1670608 RepID=A0A9P8L073_9PEZI|nr:hypothetical protein FGG08_003865 [Glutinoglossum americanum]
MTGPKPIPIHEIVRHNKPNDCWVVIEGQVWDLTEFAPQHPGGEGCKYSSFLDVGYSGNETMKVILRYAGQDATRQYNEVHTLALLPTALTISKLMGKLDTINSIWPTAQDTLSQVTHQKKPPLSSILSSHDFEIAAHSTLSKKAWAFYSSAATDLISDRANKSFYNRVWFRPRVLRDVKEVDTVCMIQGVRSSLPLFVAPAAMARLAHESGERGIAKACSKKGIIQCASINASYAIEEIVSAAPADYPFFFQLYVNKHRPSSELLLKRVWDLGIRVLFLTVDAPAPGKREADEAVRAGDILSTPMSGTSATRDKTGSGLARTMGTYIDPSLSWEDLVWLRSFWMGKVIVKGVQSVEDAKRASKEGIDGIVLSNHGGRNLDTSSPAVLVLLELRRHCPEIFSQLEVYVDGGIRRGTDILKALCLGATAVSIGRPFLYALSYGEDGVEHLIDILRDELETAMRLLGITDLSQLHSGLVNTGDIDHLVPSTQGDIFTKRGLKAKI